MSHQGTKRKRYEPTTEDLQVKIGGKLHHNLKELRKVAKKAKTFETQKLVKKLKGIRKSEGNSREIAQVEAQLEALKPMSHEVIANTVLKTRLNKDRILSQNEHVRMAASNELVSTLIPAAAGTPTAKCESRLLSSKILAAEVAIVVEDLKNLLQQKTEEHDLGMKDEDISVISRKKLKQVSKEGDLQGVDLSMRLEDQGERTEDGLPPPYNKPVSDTEEANEAGWESGTVDDNEKEMDDGWESGSLTDSDLDDAEEATAPSKMKPSNMSAPPKLPSSMMIARPSVQQSTFLPSLSVGFIRGTSEDPDFGEAAVTAGDIDIKKNRRGQRARRAIWEKKYGRNANHKKKEFEHRGLSSSGKDHRRGGTTSGQFQEAFIPWQAGSNAVTRAQYEGNRHAKAIAQNNPPAHMPAHGRKEDRSLHPSWEAKRKLKEKEGAGIVPSRGTKIKFS